MPRCPAPRRPEAGPPGGPSIPALAGPRGLSPSRVPPMVEGAACAHRSNFQQRAVPRLKMPVFEQCAPDLLLPQRAGVRGLLAAFLSAHFGSGCPRSLRCPLRGRCRMRHGCPRHEDDMTNAMVDIRSCRRKRTPSALRATGDFSGAGARACAPAHPRGMRAAR